jgi:hypothetical protein
MKKIKTSAQTTNATSTTITINNSGKILASTDLNTPTSMNFPEDERVKKILNLKKEKIYLDVSRKLPPLFRREMNRNGFNL